MGIIATLMEKSWLRKGAGAEAPPVSEEDQRASAMNVALRFYLVVVTSMFGVITLAYLMRMGLVGHGGELLNEAYDWRPLPEPGILWVNTGFLFLSSIALDRASAAARKGRENGMKTAMLIAAVSTMIFLAGQIAAWRQLDAAGYYFAGNPANTFFYFITALHGVHILGGLVALGRTSLKVWRGYEPARVRSSVYLCAIYWHFLLLVWLIMFGLLLYT